VVLRVQTPRPSFGLLTEKEGATGECGREVWSSCSTARNEFQVTLISRP
jgi:hypothetical protein